MNLLTPTPEMLRDPRYEAIWSAIKNWFVSMPGDVVGYHPATTAHARAIIDALDAAPKQKDAPGAFVKFRESARCTKCGGEKIGSAFHTHPIFDCARGCPGRNEPEPYAHHILRTCQRCGFWWAEAPLNCSATAPAPPASPPASEDEFVLAARAYRAYRFYVCASDRELLDHGLTRTEALKIAHDLDCQISRTFPGLMEGRPL